jgi:hypothetical protein
VGCCGSFGGEGAIIYRHACTLGCAGIESERAGRADDRGNALIDSSHADCNPRRLRPD